MAPVKDRLNCYFPELIANAGGAKVRVKRGTLAAERMRHWHTDCVSPFVPNSNHRPQGASPRLGKVDDYEPTRIQPLVAEGYLGAYDALSGTTGMDRG